MYCRGEHLFNPPCPPELAVPTVQMEETSGLTQWICLDSASRSALACRTGDPGSNLELENIFSVKNNNIGPTRQSV